MQPFIRSILKDTCSVYLNHLPQLQILNICMISRAFFNYSFLVNRQMQIENHRLERNERVSLLLIEKVILSQYIIFHPTLAVAVAQKWPSGKCWQAVSHLGIAQTSVGGDAAATDCTAFTTADFPAPSWDEMMTELAVVSLANHLWAARSKSRSMSLADTSCSSSCTSLREVRFCCLSLWKRMLHTQKSWVVHISWNKMCPPGLQGLCFEEGTAACLGCEANKRRCLWNKTLLYSSKIAVFI